MLTTDQEKKIIGNTDIQHTHESNLVSALARKAIANMKNQVMETNATVSAVQATVVSSLSDGVLMALPKPSSINRCLQRYRMKKIIGNTDIQQPAKVTGKKMAESHDHAHKAVLVSSGTLPVEPVVIKGYDFNNGVNFPELLKSFHTTGFQATNLAKAIDEVNRMINKKLEPLPEDVQSEINLNPCLRERTSCTIFLGYTSNMISSGVRETIRYLAEHNMIDCIVTTAGGVEEDFIKCLAPTYLGEFALCGKDLRDRGINRIGNLLAPNNNYCQFEDWMMPILDKLVEEQKEQGIVWTPSKVIARLGKEIDNPESVYYWCYKNNIPVFSPALTDGSLGDMIYFHSYKNPGLVIDIVEDIRRVNQMAIYSLNTGMIILGGGLVKHHICNANLMRNGADYCVYINTAQEFDGSDSGARPDEAVSWGKIKPTANPVKVYGEASIIFPLVVAETFAKQVKVEQDKD